jgi:ribonuclease E
MRDLLKNDRAKSKVLRISNFGLVEMTRQRLRPSLKQSLYSRCPHCDGTGQIMSEESVALRVMRSLHAACANPDIDQIEIAVSPRVAHHLLNTQRRSIADQEQDSEKTIVVTAQESLAGNDVQITCKNARGAQVACDKKNTQDAKNAQAEFVDIKDIISGKKPAAKPAQEQETSNQTDNQASENDNQTPVKKSRRRGRRGGRNRKKKNDATTADEANEKVSGESALVLADSKTTNEPLREADEEVAQLRAEATQGEALTEVLQQPEQTEPAEQAEQTEPDTVKKKPRRRGKRGGRKHRKISTETPTEDQAKPDEQTDEAGSA